MKRKVVTLILLCLFISGCNNKPRLEPMYNNLHKVTDYLYEITYNDYEYDKNLETIVSIEDFACSSVKNGNFYGRNFDFVYNDIPEFVVKVNKNKSRHASIGIGYSSNYHDNGKNKLTDKELKLLPNFMLDGINDAGVVISDNVVPKEDVIEVTGTNPSGEKLHMGLIVRFVLDNASSADDAIRLLKARNIYGNLGSHYNLHFMIADKDKTYVVEFIDNKLIAEEKKDNNQVLTNYYANLDYYTENAAGIERYNILKEYYAEGSSFEGMFHLMRRVQFSNNYLFDNEEEGYSEFLTQSVINAGGTDNIEVQENLQKLKEEYWVARALNKRNPANAKFWQTTHNSTYDIAKRKLRVVVQEKYDKYFEYELD